MGLSRRDERTQARAQTPTRHPLDPLNAAEIQRAVAVLRQSGHLTADSRFGTITVQPRSKSAHRTARRARPRLRLVAE